MMMAVEENRENVAPPPPPPHDDDEEEDETPWWTDLAMEAAAGGALSVEGMKIETFSRQCYRQFFQQKMNKETYFQCCCVSWMVQCLDDHDGGGGGGVVMGLSAAELWDATMAVLQVAGDESCMAGWILPTFKLDDLKAMAKMPSADPEEHKVYLLIQLWKRFYKACEDREKELVEQQQTSSARPTKRQRTTYQYYFSSSSTAAASQENSFDGLMKGAYKLPAAVLLISILLECQEDHSLNSSTGGGWQQLDDQVYHRLPKIFKTMTVEDIQAAMAIVGMQCLVQGRHITGLTPCLLLERYVTRTG